MESILWYQHADLDVGDVIFRNGARIEDNLLGAQYFDKIKKRADSVIRKDIPWCGTVSGFFFLKGFLTSRDELNRKMSFMYITDASDFREACIKELEAASVTMSDETLACLNRPSRQSREIYVYLAVAALIITLIIILCSNRG